MKKIFASLAAIAVASAACAFTGCGEDDNNKDNSENQPGITNPDDTENNRPEIGGGETDNGIGVAGLMEILSGIDTEKLFGDCINLGLKVDIEAIINQGEAFDANGTIAADYKMSYNRISEEEFTLAGCGEATVKAEYTVGDKTSAINIEGVMCHDIDYIYAYADGTALGMNFNKDEKIKINVNQVIDYLFSLCKVPDLPDDEDAPSEDEDEKSWFGYLLMADEFGVKITADTADGTEVHVVIDEDAAMAIVSYAIISMYDEKEVDISKISEAIEESITINTFNIDLYFSIDRDGAFEGAGVEIDVDAVVGGSLIDMMSEEDGTPDLSATVKGCVEVYLHDKTVTLSDEIKESEEYYDFTDDLLAMVDGYLNRDEEDGNLPVEPQE